MATFNLTKKADYGLSMLSLLAAKGKEGRVSLTELAERGLPKAFMAQIANKMVQAGFLSSKEGRGGGYSLINQPEKIGLRDVLEVIDGDLAPVACVNRPGTCPIEDHCWQKGFMLRFTYQMGQMMEKYTVADLIGTTIGINKKSKSKK
jgi:Rrf2 family protein